MSEEILKALMQLFAIIAKQDGGAEETERTYVKTFLKQQLGEHDVDAYMDLFDKKAQSQKKTSRLREREEESSGQLTAVGDSVKTLGIAKKINKTLSQKQKIVVLVRVYELVNADKKFTDQRMAIIATVAEVFNIHKNEIDDIRKYVTEDPESTSSENILVFEDTANESHDKHIIKVIGFEGNISVLRIESSDLYFVKYNGNNSVLINGLPLVKDRIYLFANGSTVRLPKGKPLYYSDVIAKFMRDTSEVSLSFQAKNIWFQFPNGNYGLRAVNIEEKHGKLVGIMGASGAGKTTLMNVLAGLRNPSDGQVLINGYDLFKDKEELEGVIGYIPQDDLLIEELTVYQNLFYNAKLCFKDLDNQTIDGLVEKTLRSLGLFERRHLKVGSPLNQLISGGQRKRLNIALELIREPSVLFVDEPTSGLSSRDSENVMDLLRELSLKGKLIFVVIHQPSSDIYKMFDRMIILDTGGYLIYSGNPVEAVMYFKRLDSQVNSDIGECRVCGNVNPELIFNIIEAKVVDEYGRYQEKRKVLPETWAQFYKTEFQTESVETVKEKPPKSLSIPAWFKQIFIYGKRDFLSKVSNMQYIIMNLLEAPLLAFILSYIIRYIADPHSTNYIFRENENIPPYIFMTIVVALFLGLTVSAEEIFKDRKILKREKFLNLSRSSYLLSKIAILFVLSAIQMFLFVLIGNFILGVKGMLLEYWLVLFTTAAFANIIGLNISAAFNSVVTIYIMIPLILIPQMILGGAMFSFDKLNRSIGTVEKVPVIAEFMASKWAYEALMVNQFVNNAYEKQFYNIDQEESVANYKQIYYLPELKEKLDFCYNNAKSTDPEVIEKVENDLNLLKNEFTKQHHVLPQFPIDQFVSKLQRDSLTIFITFLSKSYIEELNTHYSNLFSKANGKKEQIIAWAMEHNPELYKRVKDDYRNDAVADIVKNIYEKNQFIRYNNNLIQQIDPIFMEPRSDDGYFNFRSHFYAPHKYFAGKFYNTFNFNLIVVWIMTIIFYITLYYNALGRLLILSEKVEWSRYMKLGRFFTNFIKKRKNEI
ncbi:MAG: ATP-binding cassette domain-containing protein [Bacteroidales bacterium]|nr:ATP-binding cassette domain-containing protein [Bacteroidales bacterium]